MVQDLCHSCRALAEIPNITESLALERICVARTIRFRGWNPGQTVISFSFLCLKCKKDVQPLVRPLLGTRQF